MISLALGESRKVIYDWTQALERFGTTLSSNTWTYDGTATLASPTTVSGKVSVLFTPTSDGILTNSATFADGQIFYQQYEVSVG